MQTFLKKRIALTMPIVLYLLFSLLSSRFDLSNFTIILIQSIIPTMIGFALYQLLAGGLFDLSFGAQMILAAYIGGEMSKKFGVIGLVLGCLLSGILLSAITGILYTLLKIPSMVLSMCLVMLYEPLPYILFKKPYISIPKEIAYLGKQPYNILIAVAIFIIFYLISYHTKYSCHLRTIGSDEDLASILGIKTKKVKLQAYLIAGMFSGVASLLYICYSNNISYATSLSSISLVFKPLMGVMIAMELVSSINVGFGILIGEFCIAVLFNGLIALGLPSTWQNMTLGLFLLFVIAITNNRTSISLQWSRFKSLFLWKKQVDTN